MQEGDDNINRVVDIPFPTMGDLKDIKYIDGIWMSFHGSHTAVEKALRNQLGAAHGFRPSDRNAIYVANIMEQLSQFRLVSIALQALLLFIGVLTLGIAGIGLMNIMLVSVQQRTREIGVEKALGARKRHILFQFLAEAMVITGVGGIGGIVLAVTVSKLVGGITFYSAIAKNGSAADIYLLISPNIVIVATSVLVVVGVVSGMIPAIQAANLDPIEALRYE
jgi:putative ABC transport system permease protein